MPIAEPEAPNRKCPPATRELRCDFHLHTSDDRFDRIPHDVFALIQRAHELDFDVIAVTNHLGVSRRPDARDFAAERGILLLDGVELTIKGRHVLCINPAEDVDPKKIRQFPDLAAIRRPETLIIPAHPFFPGPTHFGDLLVEHAEFWDALELSHFHVRGIDFNQRTREVALQTGLPLFATSDTHVLDHMGTSFTTVTAEPTAHSVAAAVRAKRLAPESRPLGYWEAARFLRRTFATAGKSPSPPGHRRTD